MDEAGAETTVGDRQILPALAPRPDVQGLRALAVCVVIVGHAHIAGFTGGYVGVDVFFVVSGYLISTPPAARGDEYRSTSASVRSTRDVPDGSCRPRGSCSLSPRCSPPSSCRCRESRRSSVTRAGRRSSWPMCTSRRSARTTSSRTAPPHRCSTPGRWPWRSSSTWSGRWPCCSSSGVFARRRLLVTRIVVLAAWSASLVWSVRPDGELTRGGVLLLGDAGLGAGHRRAARSRRSSAEPPACRARHVLAVVGLAAIAAAVGWYDESTAFPGWHAPSPSRALQHCSRPGLRGPSALRGC